MMTQSLIGWNLIEWKRHKVGINLKTFKELIDISRERDHTLDPVEDFPYAVMEYIDADITNANITYANITMTQVVLINHKFQGANESMLALKSN